uniref:nucleoside diphosphate-linked moiety X motif 17 isoform X2 n=1 Tax=Myxine glutinosa TaxID=7769 RepID=UPI00358FC3C4
MERVLVFLVRKLSSTVCAKFTQSVTGYFNNDCSDVAMVCYKLTGTRLLIAGEGELSDAENVLLKRAHHCPVKLLSKQQALELTPLRAGGVEVGVSVILQSSDHNVLVTRRACHLKLFPGYWVPPGGHIEPHEQITAAGLRELQEEAGIQINPSHCTVLTLGLWESVHPTQLNLGLPQRHHIVIYLLIRSSRHRADLQEEINLCENEVNACAWIEPNVARVLVFGIEPKIQNLRPNISFPAHGARTRPHYRDTVCRNDVRTAKVA